MKKYLPYLYCLCLLLLMACPTKPPTEEIIGEGNKYQGLDSLIKGKIQQGKIKGLSLAVISHQKIAYLKSYGYADVRQSVHVPNQWDSLPVMTSTQFMTLESSYSFVATALFQLQESGKIRLDADINRYLSFQVKNPHFPQDSITIAMLLCGVSSIKDNYLPKNTGDSPIKLKDYLKAYLPIDGLYYTPNNYATTAPGTTPLPSSIGMALAGYIVEEVSHISLNDYCKAYIYPQLGIHHCSYFLSELDSNDVAAPYRFQTNGYIRMPHYGFPYYPAGQLRISPEHSARWLLALQNGGQYLQGKILNNNSILMMKQIPFPNAFPNAAFGWKYWQENGRTLLGSSGMGLGVSNVMYYDTLSKSGVVIYCNSDSSTNNIRQIMWKALELADKE